MRRFALVALAAAVLAPAAAAAKITASSSPAGITVTGKMQTAGVYAASCEVPGWNIGTSGNPTGRGKVVTVTVPFPPAGVSAGPFTCWLRSDLSLFGAPPAALKGGKPATVSGTLP